VAIPGEHSDGHDFIDMAREMGAVAVISDRSDDAHAGADTIVVQHARRALGVIAHALQGDPSRGLNVIGVTGTNGKSSTVMMIRHLLQSCGHGTACFGTLGNWIGGSYCEAQHTTSFNEELADLFARARDAGDTHVVMEVSSHALEQERVAGVDFDVALFQFVNQIRVFKGNIDFKGVFWCFLTGA